MNAQFATANIRHRNAAGRSGGQAAMRRDKIAVIARYIGLRVMPNAAGDRRVVGQRLGISCVLFKETATSRQQRWRTPTITLKFQAAASARSAACSIPKKRKPVRRRRETAAHSGGGHCALVLALRQPHHQAVKLCAHLDLAGEAGIIVSTSLAKSSMDCSIEFCSPVFVSHSGSTYTWQVAHAQKPPQSASMPARRALTAASITVCPNGRIDNVFFAVALDVRNLRHLNPQRALATNSFIGATYPQ